MFRSIRTIEISMSEDDEPETFEPECIVATIPLETVYLENPITPLIDYLSVSSALGSDPLVVMTTEWLATANNPPENDPVPESTQESERTEVRRRRTNAHKARFDKMIEECRAKSWRLSDPFAMVRWKTLIASEALGEGKERGHVFAQPPANIVDVVDALWSAGMRIEGFHWRDSILSTTLNAADEMDRVREMVVWLHNYCAIAPLVGVPPPPWRLTAARSLVERIRHYDSPNAAN